MTNFTCSAMVLMRAKTLGNLSELLHIFTLLTNTAKLSPRSLDMTPLITIGTRRTHGMNQCPTYSHTMFHTQYTIFFILQPSYMILNKNIYFISWVIFLV